MTFDNFFEVTVDDTGYTIEMFLSVVSETTNRTSIIRLLTTKKVKGSLFFILIKCEWIYLSVYVSVKMEL